MYNYQRITELLRERGISNKSLLDYLGKNYNGHLGNILGRDIRVSMLEKVADFFGVPIDTFFDRDPNVKLVNVSGNRNHVHDFNKTYDKKILTQLLDEKDKRISLLEEMLSMYKNIESTKTVGQNPDKSVLTPESK